MASHISLRTNPLGAKRTSNMLFLWNHVGFHPIYYQGFHL